jgi:RNA 3'-phosphate cyclase
MVNKNINFLKIDGSMGEGGGSVLRLSAGFAVLFNQPVKIYNIRANRSQPGLRLQHLLGLQTLAQLTESDLSECEVGTTELRFIPNTSTIKEKIDVNIRTAASIGLLLQPIQIGCLGFGHSNKVVLDLEGGGTLGKWAPGLNYLKNVSYQIFNNVGYTMNVNIKKYGFYPKGGALTTCEIFPPKKTLEPLNITELGTINLIEGKIACNTQLSNARVSERIKRSADKYIRNKLNIETDIQYEYVKSLSVGVGLSLWAHSDTGAIISSGTVLGEKHISSEEVGKMAANKIIKYIRYNIPVDNYLSDQLLPLMAHIDHPSSIKVLEVTNHARTNLELIKLFIDREYTIEKSKEYSIITLK